jgi:hypothetical protein
MKKAIVSLVVLTLISSATFAQLSGGIRAGLNLANQKFKSDDLDLDDKGDMKAGLQLGLYLVGNLSENLAVQPELVYSSYGANGEDDSQVKMGYISIPIFLRYNFNEMVNLHVGPQFGILASAKDDEGEDIKEGFKGADMGVAVGLGLDFGAFNAGLRYYAGLSNIADTDAIGVDDIKYTNSAIQIVVGYRLFGGE